MSITAPNKRLRTKYSMNSNSKNSKHGHEYNSKYSIQNRDEGDFDEEELTSNFDVALGYYNREFYDNALVLLNEE